MAKVIATDHGTLLTSPVNAHSLTRGDMIAAATTDGPHNLLTVLSNRRAGRSQILTVRHGLAAKEFWTTPNHPYHRVTGSRSGG